MLNHRPHRSICHPAVRMICHQSLGVVCRQRSRGICQQRSKGICQQSRAANTSQSRFPYYFQFLESSPDWPDVVCRQRVRAICRNPQSPLPANRAWRFASKPPDLFAANRPGHIRANFSSLRRHDSSGHAMETYKLNSAIPFLRSDSKRRRRRACALRGSRCRNAACYLPEFPIRFP